MKHSIRTKASSKGIKLTLIQVEDAEVVEIRLYFKAGFKYFPAAEHHVPHMLEHLILGQNRESTEVQYLTHTLQRLGAMANASTDNDHIIIELSAPVATAMEAIQSILHILANPALDGEVFESERQIVLREAYERYDGLGAVMGARLLGQLLVPTTPEDPDQEVESIAELTPERVKEVFDQVVHTRNLQVIASGATTPVIERALLKLLDEFVPVSPTAIRPFKDLIEPPKVPIVVTQIGGDDQNASCVLAVICANSKSLSRPERVANNMAFNMLFGTLDAILPNTLRRLGYVYSISCEQVNFGNQFIFTIALTAAAAKLPLAITEVYALIRRYANTPFPSDEFESISLYAQHSLPTAMQTPLELLGWYEGDILSGRTPTDVASELDVIAKLTDVDLSVAIKRNLVNTIWHWSAIAPNIDVWGEQMSAALNDPKTRKANEKTLRNQLEAVIAGIPGRKTVKKAAYWDDLVWIVFSLVEFTVLLMLIYAPTFSSSSGAPISMSQLAMDSGLYWLFATPIAPLALGGLIGFMIDRKGAKELDILLGLIAAGGYWTFLAIGGHLAQGGFWPTVASLIYPAFFGLIVGLAIMSRVRIWAVGHRLNG